MSRLGVFTLAVALAAAPAPASSQALLAGDARALGLAGSFTASVRDGAAVLWNPARLGVPGSARWSVILPSAGFGAVSAPIGAGDWLRRAGDDAPLDVRTAWFESVAASGGQWGRGSMDLTGVALAWGRSGLALTTTIAGDARLSPDAARLGLFGNGPGPGAASQYSLAGTDLAVVGMSTLTLSRALRVAGSPSHPVQVGVSAHGHVGHFIAAATDNGSVALDDPRWVRIDLPVVALGDLSPTGRGGSGWSASVAAAWTGPDRGASIVLRDVVGDFAWRGGARYQPVRVTITEDERTTNFESGPLRRAPVEVQAWAAGVFARSPIAPEVRLGMYYQPSSTTTVSAEYRHRLDPTPAAPAGSRGGVAVERRVTSALDVQAGLSLGAGGALLGSGVSARWRSLSIGAALAAARAGGAWGPRAMFSIGISPAPDPEAYR